MSYRMHAAARVLLFSVLLGGWQCASLKGWINPFLLPSPLDLIRGVIRLSPEGTLFKHSISSLVRIGSGYFISVALAIPLGVILGWNSRIRYYVSPLLALVRPIPPIAWIPLAILWFGIGNGPSLFVTAMASFFPILMNTIAGIEQVDHHHVDVARSLGASPSMILHEVALPSALPYILVGMRLGLVVAWMSVVAAEIVSARTGLGYFIETNQEMVHSDLVVVGMLMIALLGIVLDLSLVRLKEVLIRW